MADAVRAEHVHPPRAQRPAHVRAQLQRPARAGNAGRSGQTRHPQRHLHRPRLRHAPNPHRRHTLRGRAQEGDVHGHELPHAQSQRPVDALLRQHRRARRQRVVLRLSGTGKTTLSADPQRQLIGDDEHGWSDEGVFNFEGGCYAKAINLTEDSEPDIYRTTQMFGTVLENVVLDPNSLRPDFTDTSLTENTRVSYPLPYIRNHAPGGRGGHPKNVVLLTADAFGVLPPIARLTRDQALYYFLSGYTAKVAGTERGVTEPQATFSACFGAVFLVWPPTKYAEMLGARLDQHKSKVWLVNTGWTGGPFGVGSRMKLGFTRAMVRAALSGELDA